MPVVNILPPFDSVHKPSPWDDATHIQGLSSIFSYTFMEKVAPKCVSMVILNLVKLAVKINHQCFVVEFNVLTYSQHILWLKSDNSQKEK